jgi:Ras-related protein Rab-18
LQTWFTELETYSSSKDIAKMIVGNKIDKESERVVDRKEGLAFAKKMSALFLECSAKTNIAVEQAFEELVQKVRFVLVQVVETPVLWQKQQRGKESASAVKTLKSNTDENSLDSSSCSC